MKTNTLQNILIALLLLISPSFVSAHGAPGIGIGFVISPVIIVIPIIFFLVGRENSSFSLGKKLLLALLYACNTIFLSVFIFFLFTVTIFQILDYGLWFQFFIIGPLPILITSYVVLRKVFPENQNNIFIRLCISGVVLIILTFLIMQSDTIICNTRGCFYLPLHLGVY